jgi:hypothetical protein
MAMRSATSPRRVYPRAGSLVLTYGGVYFGPKHNTKSEINPDKEVRITVLDRSGGKARIEVAQKDGTKEIWTEKHLTFVPRSEASAG